VKILLVDDDRDLLELLCFALSRAAFATHAAYDAPMALRLLDEARPDLAVLDVDLGDWDGFDLLRELRRRSQIPVILLTARDGEEDKVRGLDLGADDYVTKPFSHRELIARIRAHLRRLGNGALTPGPVHAQLQVGPITLDLALHRVAKNGQPLSLTLTEFRLLHYLMANAERVVPTRDVLHHVWGYDDDLGAADLVRVTVHRLRRKLEDEPAKPRLLHTVAGVGIILKPGPVDR